MVKPETIERRTSLYEKVIKQNLTIDEIKQLTRLEYNKHFGTKVRTKKSLEGQHKLLNQIAKDLTPIETQHFQKQNITNKNIIEGTKKAGKEIFKPDYSLTTRAKPITPKTKGTYQIAKVYDIDSDKEYFVKYKNKSSFYRQLEQIKKKEKEKQYFKPSKFKNVSVIFYGYRKYIPYAFQQYKQLATPP